MDLTLLLDFGIGAWWLFTGVMSLLALLLILINLRLWFGKG